MSKRALITGINGQDGSYLAELLLSKGYEVHGVIRRASTSNTERIDHLFNPDERGRIHYGDLADGLADLIAELKPDELYNMASMSHVRISFDIPEYTGDITGLGVTRLLHNIYKLSPKTKFYQASSSEMFGLTPPPQNENSPFDPVSPYGCAKLYGYHMTRTYRLGYNLFASNGILFNHESERRGINFVTRKVTRAIARIKLGLIDKLPLGNLDAKRDWGHSQDYMRAIWMIMQHDRPDDFIVSTGEYHTVKEFVELAFQTVNLDPWKYIVIEDHYKRPNEVPALLGDSTKIRKVLGWKPEIEFEELVHRMVLADLLKETACLKR